MILSCIQPDVKAARPEENYRRMEARIRQAAAAGADLILLPELWDLGFFPREELRALADPDLERVCTRIGALAGQLRVNIAAGSVACRRGDRVCNTACVFDREGCLAAQYEKTHLFSPMGEQEYFTPGDRLCRFTLDGHSVGLIICYDLRFPELSRALALQGIELLLVPAQWPGERIRHLELLTEARAVENQIFVACCNNCGSFGQTRFGGHSRIVDPWGCVLTRAGEIPEIVTAGIDFGITEQIRSSMPIFADRRPELY